MQIPHDVLVGADHEDAEVVHFARSDAMQRQGVLHILQVDKFRDFAVGIARDVDQHAVAIGKGVEAMDRHDRE